MKQTLLAILMATTLAQATESKLWYEKPAAEWEQEALPIGNGRLGAMIFGGVEREQIQFNEDSLWTGDEADTGSYQNFGELFVEFATDGSPAANYRRELDIARAVHLITYMQGVQGVSDVREYNREAFNLVRLAKDNQMITSSNSSEEEDDGKVRAGGSSEGSVVEDGIEEE